MFDFTGVFFCRKSGNYFFEEKILKYVRGRQREARLEDCNGAAISNVNNQ